jgi:LytS/YehU family sensor histidine kinase
VELSEDYLVKFSKLIRLFFEYSRKQNITIEEEINLLKNYLEIEKLRFEDKINYKITVDPRIDKEEQHLPAMMLQPIVENAINHGLFHKKEEGSICVAFDHIDENIFKITIEDNGIGYLKADEIYKNSKSIYQSRSSNVLKERLELLKLSNEWHIEYAIEDLSQISDSTGTKVTLLFKQPQLP